MNRSTPADDDSDFDMDIEDYGSPESDEERLSALEAESKRLAQQSQSGLSGGTEGMRPGGNEGEEFGEFEDTGEGVDLNETMANPNVRPDLAAEADQGEANRGIPPQFGGGQRSQS